MNTVPGHVVEEVPDNAEADRRRGMRLISIASAKKRSRLRIDVDDSLLHEETRTGSRKRLVSTKKDLPKGKSIKVSGSMVILATVAGLALGFLVGRKRNS